MQSSKEEYAIKRIHNGCEVQIENSVTRVTVRHHEASIVMSNSYPRDGIFNQHLAIIEDSYSPNTAKLLQLNFPHTLLFMFLAAVFRQIILADLF